jgi:peroxiredoxin
MHCDAALGDYRGRPLVLAFYVADWHPVCTAQLERYAGLSAELERHDAGLVAISVDTVWSHAAFARAHGLPFPLLADSAPRGAVARAYGVYDARTERARRALFVLDGAGTIAWSAAFPEGLDPGVDGILTALERLLTDSPGGGDTVVHEAPSASHPLRLRPCYDADTKAGTLLHELVRSRKRPGGALSDENPSRH